MRTGSSRGHGRTASGSLSCCGGHQHGLRCARRAGGGAAGTGNSLALFVYARARESATIDAIVALCRSRRRGVPVQLSDSLAASRRLSLGHHLLRTLTVPPAPGGLICTAVWARPISYFKFKAIVVQTTVVY